LRSSPVAKEAFFLQQVSLGRGGGIPAITDQATPTFRFFEPSDEEELSRMLTDFQDDLKAKDPEGRMKCEHGFGQQYLEVLLQDVREHDGAIVVCKMGGKLIGFAACMLPEPSPYDELEYIEEKTGRITELYVAPDFRGRGIGKHLLRTMEDILRTKKCTRVELGVMRWNMEAHALYEKLGYREQHIRMAKPL
jgi:ribosomal protein S18 acetylase RimI-like enzyme